MLFQRRRSRIARIAALLALVSLIAAGCGSDDGGDDEATETTEAKEKSEFVAMSGVPGVTDDAINFSALGTITNNPLGTCDIECLVDGVEAYFAYINSEGGIYGRELKVSKVVDDEFGKNQQKAIEIISANDTFGIFGTGLAPTGWKAIADANIPLFGRLSDPGAAARPSIFGSANADCVTCTRIDTAFLAKALGAKKAASLALGVSDSSKKCGKSIVDSIKKYSSNVGGTTLAYENLNLAYGLPNGAGPEVKAMKDAGVDLVYTCFDHNTAKTIAQEMERQGIGDVPIVHRNAYDAKIIGDNAAIFEGDVILASVRPLEGDDGDSTMDLYRKWMEETGSETSELSIHGWAVATAAVDGMKEVGGAFDRQKVIDAINTFEQYTAGGIIPPIDYGRQHLPPTEEDITTHGSRPYCRVLLLAKGGKFEFLKPSSKTKPFVCFPGTSRDYVEPTGTDFK
jgi:ABC-type branched-subunit amino acid transport system substrate-binding protein